LKIPELLTLLSLSGPPHSQVGLFKGSPFEVFLEAATLDLSSFALVTGRLVFVALQPLRLAGDATWAMRIDRVSSLRT
jgi:hypothetical protein